MRAHLLPWLTPLLATTALAAEPADPPPWDVNAPPGPARYIPIDADEGTWLSLDVSPDGERIVFDFLGDIFIVPMNGGPAEQLSEGMAWDMQPRFSPDGRHIAFISDRDGADNLWIMGTFGEGPRQLSEEDFRLVPRGEPARSPEIPATEMRPAPGSRGPVRALESFAFLSRNTSRY